MKTWNFEEYDFLYRHYNILSKEVIAKKLECSVEQLEIHANELGLKDNNDLSEDEMYKIRKYKNSLGTALVFLMPYRTVHELEVSL